MAAKTKLCKHFFSRGRLIAVQVEGNSEGRFTEPEKNNCKLVDAWFYKCKYYGMLQWLVVLFLDRELLWLISGTLNFFSWEPATVKLFRLSTLRKKLLSQVITALLEHCEGRIVPRLYRILNHFTKSVYKNPENHCTQNGLVVFQ